MFELSNSPRYHPDCCLSLSSRLFQTIKESVQDVVASGSQIGAHLISIGCGTGFFEATLATYLVEHGVMNFYVEGIEVDSARTPYLPNERLHRVQGTRDICEHAEKADVLIFVYPRAGELVRRYLEQFPRTVALVLWLGPQADWAEQQPMLHNVATFGEPTVIENAGLAQYELAVLFKNTTQSNKKSRTTIETKVQAPYDTSIDHI